MAETQIPLDIGAKAIIRLQEYMCTGVLKIEKKKFIFSVKPVQKYFIISKGAKDNNWILFCFSDQDATRAEWAHSMLQIESVRKYDKGDVVGFRIVFIEAKMQEIILICDTKENREMWMSKMVDAINDTHSFSKDSGFESGGSIAGLQRGAFRNSKNCGRGFNNYDTIDDACIDETQDNKDNEKQNKMDLVGDVQHSEETILKHPTSAEESSEAMTLSLPQSSARSESFASVEAASDPCLPALSMSSLYVSGGTDDTSSFYQNVEFRIHQSSSNDRNSSSSSGSDTTVYDYPTCLSQVVEQDEYVCEDGHNPIEILRDTPRGTFLIDRKKKWLRLYVMTQAGVKCFKLFEQNGKVSLYKDFSILPDSVFLSLDNFLKHYSVHCIPKEEYSVRLTQGYRKVIKESVEWK